VCSEAALLFPLEGASGVVLTRPGCRRRFEMGGPLMQGEGDYDYSDGGSTSLLIAPVRKGEPYMSHVHFSPGHRQAQHFHITFRFTLVVAGHGKVTVPANQDGTGADVIIPLAPGDMFVIPAGGVHSIDASDDEALDVVTFHPDSVVGWTDHRHPMRESTVVNRAADSLAA